MLVRVRSSNALGVASEHSAHSAAAQPTRKISAGKAFGAAIFIVAVSASSGAMAQNCGPLPAVGTVVAGGNPNDWKAAFGAGIASASAMAATINAANTAFLSHSTAFVSAPGNPPPDSQGGGVWIRGVGGESKTKSSGTTSFNYNAPAPSALTNSGSTNCNSTFKQDFAGVQLGTDIARLNMGGWNIHFGATAGYLGTKGDVEEGATPLGGAFNTHTQAPFVGTYAVATNGGFFIDGLLRYNYYETKLDSPAVNIYGQKVDAHGVSFGGSMGYHAVLPNSNWFVEPSAGFVWSRVSIDPLQMAGFGAAGTNFQGTTQINDITSTLGRAGVRVGTTVDAGNMVLQPFAAASIWRDFQGGWSANYSSCTACIFQTNGANPTVVGALGASMNGSGVGTYGVYSLGIAGQIKDSGWLGYVRVDRTAGANLDGWTGSGGLRYQFTPEAVRTAMVTKAPVKVAAPVSWTGFYVGGFGGAAYKGKAEETFAPAPATAVTAAFPGGTSTSQLDGALGGGTVGYNYQMGAWVYGLETDLAWTNAKGSIVCGNLSAPPAAGTPANALFNVTCHDQTNWLLTAAGRVGYAWGRALYFAKAGAAWTHETFSVTCNLGPINGSDGVRQSCFNPAGVLMTNATSASDNRMGWTIGVGSEFALTEHWSAKSEVSYLSFGNRTLTANDGTVVSTKLSLVEAKIGVNYRFGTR